MKRVLSFLLSVIFLHAQVSTALAKSGGPDVAGTQNVDTVGTYAGVLIPTETSTTGASNSIGLFSINVPDAGVATGACVVFVEGTAYNGTITGVADPINGSLVGIMEATSTYAITDPAGNAFTPYAQGNVVTQIKETASFNENTISIQTFSFATTRLEGTAELDIIGSTDPTTNAPVRTNSVSFIVDGFKQSNQLAASNISIGGGNGGGGGVTVP